MKTLALLTLSLTMLASISASFSEPSYHGHGTYPGDQQKCTTPFDWRCSNSNG